MALQSGNGRLRLHAETIAPPQQRRGTQHHTAPKPLGYSRCSPSALARETRLPTQHTFSDDSALRDNPGRDGRLTFFMPSYRFFSTLTTPADITAAQRADPPSPGSMIASTPGSFLAPLMRAKTSSVPAC